MAKIKWLGNMEKNAVNQAIQRGLLRETGVKTVLILIKGAAHGLLSSNNLAEPEHVSDNLYSDNSAEMEVRIQSAIDNMLSQDKKVFILTVNNEETGIALRNLLTRQLDKVA